MHFHQSAWLATVLRLGAAIVMLAVSATSATLATARDNPTNATSSVSLGVVSAADLPRQARDTLLLIRQGGPFPYPKKDGSVFGNRERLLPREPRGHYKEYTVITPGSRDRGARRIVCGGDTASVSRSTCFYTDDHYASFKRIKE